MEALIVRKKSANDNYVYKKVNCVEKLKKEHLTMLNELSLNGIMG